MLEWWKTTGAGGRAQKGSQHCARKVGATGMTPGIESKERGSFTVRQITHQF